MPQSSFGINSRIRVRVSPCVFVAPMEDACGPENAVIPNLAFLGGSAGVYRVSGTHGTIFISTPLTLALEIPTKNEK